MNARKKCKQLKKELERERKLKRPHIPNPVMTDESKMSVQTLACMSMIPQFVPQDCLMPEEQKKEMLKRYARDSIMEALTDFIHYEFDYDPCLYKVFRCVAKLKVVNYE